MSVTTVTDKAVLTRSDLMDMSTTTADDLAFDVKCSQCGTAYRSEIAHVGKYVKCNCGCLVRIVPPLDALNSLGNTDQPRPGNVTAPLKSSAGKTPLWLGIAVLVIVALVVLGRPGVKQPSQTNREWQVVAEEPATTEPSHSNARPSTYHTLPTGTRLDDDVGTNGHGELTVENGTDEDAVVRLYDSSDQPVRSFFVQSRSKSRIGHIPEGPYHLAFTTGLDWVESDDSFRWQPEYFDFERTFVFVEQADSDGIRYKALSVTLHPVLDGNIKRRTISREEFLKGHRHSTHKRAVGFLSSDYFHVG